MSDNNKNRGKSLSDFLRYRKGEMTGEERNSFERELQKDPFANEASEGFESLSPGEILNDLKKIENSIPKAKARIKGFVLYRIAASVAVLMVISTIFILVERNRPEIRLAESVKISEPFEISKGEPVIQKIAENIQTIPDRNTAQKKEENSVSGGAAAETRQDAFFAKGKDFAEKNVKDSVTAPDVKQVEIYLAEEKISAHAAMAKTRSTDYSQYISPQPVTGKAAFDKYIEENIHRPDTTTEGQRVVVVINFTVLSDGSVDSIKIIRSPGKAFSDEAIRLLKSGPQWKPAEENGKVIDDEVRLRIVFR